MFLPAFVGDLFVSLPNEHGSATSFLQLRT